MEPKSIFAIIFVFITFYDHVKTDCNQDSCSPPFCHCVSENCFCMVKVNTSNLRGNDQNEGCYPALACLKEFKATDDDNNANTLMDKFFEEFCHMRDL